MMILDLETPQGDLIIRPGLADTGDCVMQLDWEGPKGEPRRIQIPKEYFGQLRAWLQVYQVREHWE